MYSFKIAERLEDVPEQWIYEHYLDLKAVMDGNPIKTRSFINNDSTPSLHLYVKDGRYRWKDFSSGKGGNAIDIVIQKSPIPIGYREACAAVVKDYNKYVVKHGPYKPTKIDATITDWALNAEYELRDWNEVDEDYWLKRYGIPERLLDYYNVKPLQWYQLSKKFQTHTQTYQAVCRPRIYGYFKEDGTLYQIYQPDYQDLKFIKLKSHIQGIEQLNYDKDILIIGASLKDILVNETLFLDIENIAPPSETTYLGAEDIDNFKQIYTYIFTMFDNDAAGIRAMKYYKALYGIDYIFMPFRKDQADFRYYDGYNKVKSETIIRINKKINNV